VEVIPGQRPEPKLAVVAEAFLDRSLSELLDWLSASVPEVTALELGSGGYAPHPHCDRELLLAGAQARGQWMEQIDARGLSLAALNTWGNPLHPDPAVAEAHDRDLRQTIRLAAELGVDRIVCLAGCPAAAAGDRAPHFAAGGWLPYLEGVHEEQWERSVVPYWQDLSQFARQEHPDLWVCLELHPGTVVYNVETFSQLAELGDNLAANIDPSHFFWQQMDALAVVEQIRDRVGHVHAKDVSFNREVLATAGLLDHRWPGPTSDVPWKFSTVGNGHPAEWWTGFLAALNGTGVKAVAIEHEDPDVPPDTGVPQAARLLHSAVEVLT
jgi:sugar phosphate isomerase/epimerase